MKKDNTTLYLDLGGGVEKILCMHVKRWNVFDSDEEEEAPGRQKLLRCHGGRQNLVCIHKEQRESLYCRSCARKFPQC